MSATPILPSRIIATLLALVLAWALWVLSGSVMDWLGVPVLLPLVHLGVVLGGLSLAEILYAAIARRRTAALGGPQASPDSEGPER